MGGVWIGYLWAIAVCGVLLALIGACTAALYVVARMRREPRVRVETLPRGE